MNIEIARRSFQSSHLYSAPLDAIHKLLRNFHLTFVCITQSNLKKSYHTIENCRDSMKFSSFHFSVRFWFADCFDHSGGCQLKVNSTFSINWTVAQSKLCVCVCCRLAFSKYSTAHCSKMSGAKQSFKITNASEGPKLTPAQIAFMKLTEEENLKRVRKLEAIRKRNWMTGWTLGFCVLSIYAYTIFTVKQERFLDDFKEPEKIIVAKE